MSVLLSVLCGEALSQESEGVYRIAYAELGSDGIAQTSEVADSIDSAKALVVGEAASNVVIGSLGTLATATEDAKAGNNSPILPEDTWIIDHWNESDGLPDSNARKILQTRDGYLWVATVYGLARFDGVQFRTFDERNTEAFARAGQNCLSLAEHPDGSLWIGVDNGAIRKFGSQFDQILGVEGRVNDLLVDDSGSVWMASNRGIFESRAGMVIRHTQGNPEVEGLPSYLCMSKSDRDKIWFGGSRFWGTYDFSRRSWSERIEVPFSITDVLETPGRRYLLGTSSDGVFAFSPHRQSLDAVPIKSGAFSGANHVSSLFRDNDGTMFACVYHRGIFRLEGGDWRRTSIHLPSDEPRSMIQDTEGAYWIGTRDMGIFRVRRSPVTMVSLRQPPEFRTVNAVAEASDGSMWFCSYGGIVRFGAREMTAYHTVPLYGTFGFPPNCLAEDIEGDMWFNFSQRGLCRLPSSSSLNEPDSLQPQLRYPEIASYDLAQCLAHEAAGEILLGTASGLYEIHNDKPRRLTTADGLPNDDVRCVKKSPKGEVWIGTMSGIMVRGKGSRTIGVKHGLPDSRVYSILFSAARPGATWIGTENGLALLSSGRIRTVTTRNGLPDPRILSIQEDEFDRLWILGGSGIYRAGIAELEAAAHDGSRVNCTLYGRGDGLLSVATGDGYQHQSCKTQDGQLWFATHGGVAVIDPKTIVDFSATPLASVDRILAGGRIVLDQDNGSPRISRQNSDIVAIEYTVRSFTSPSTTPVQYQLLGFDSKWHDGTGERAVRYTNLSPGKYTFRIKAANQNGKWTEKPSALSIVVEPGLHERLWFRLLLGGGVVALIGLFFKFRLSLQRRRLAQESREALEAERLRIAEDVHAEIGSRLAHAVSCTSRSSSPSEALAATRKALEHSFDALREVIWLTKPKNDDVNSFCDFVMDYGERLLRQAGITVTFDCPRPGLANPLIKAQVRHCLLTAYKGILSNVVRHAGASNVKCRIVIEGEQITILVTDDGCGFEISPSAPAKRNGLDDIESVMGKIGGTARIQSGLGQGTQVEVSAPIAPLVP